MKTGCVYSKSGITYIPLDPFDLEKDHLHSFLLPEQTSNEYDGLLCTNSSSCGVEISSLYRDEECGLFPKTPAIEFDAFESCLYVSIAVKLIVFQSKTVVFNVITALIMHWNIPMCKH